MKRSKFSEEQIVYAIRQAEAGTPVGDLCRQLGVSDATFYAWKKQYAHLGVSELRRLRQVEEENSRLANGSSPTSRSTSTCCRRPCEKKSKARTPSRTGRLVSRRRFRSVACGPVASPSSVGPPGIDGVERKISPRLRLRIRDLAHARPAVWVSADLGAPASRRLARESETGATALSTGGLAAPHAGAATQAYRVASWPGSDPDRSYGALEHGFRA